jgi:fumarate reductase subunit D
MTGTGPLEKFRALREIGIVVIALLALIVAMVVVQLLISLNSNLGGSAAPHLLSQLDRVCGIVMLVAGIVFVVWLHRARINAEYSSFRQRRARAWTFWGWIVPIVSLWIPFQVLGDIWRPGLPAGSWEDTAPAGS